MNELKQLALIGITLFAINANAQQKISNFQHKRDVGRKAVVDTTINEVVNGKYKPIKTKPKPKQIKPIVIIDVQETLKQITYKQNKAGKLLIESKKMRVDGLLWTATCTGVGVIIAGMGKGNKIANGVGYGFMLLGGTMSIVKLVGAFKKIEDAGKILID